MSCRGTSPSRRSRRWVSVCPRQPRSYKLRRSYTHSARCVLDFGGIVDWRCCKRWVATDLAPQETVRAVVARFQHSSVFIIAMLMSGAVPGSSLFLRP
jgi:hypothetical protein